MSTLVSKTNGNFTASTTFAQVSSAAENDSEAATTTIGTGNTDSSSFVLEANQVDAVAIKLSSRIASPGSNTLTVILRNSTTSTNIASITVNLSDINSNGNGWYVFPLGLNHTPNGTDSYVIRVTASVASACVLFTSATTNLARQVRRTSTATPSSGDKLIIAGEHTGAGTGNDFTVTMDSTATTSYGSVSFPQSISINKRGTLTFGTSSSTAYNLKFKGLLAVYGGGTLNTGTTGAAMPSTSSATITLDVATNVDSGISIANGGTWNGRGNALTAVKAKLAVDASAAATSLTTDISTGWKSGDVIILAPTARTQSEVESKSLSGDASGTTLSINALTNAHSGTNDSNGDIRCELGNLTRNVKINGTSSSLQGYIVFAAAAIVDLQYIEFSNLGSATSGKRGIDVQITTGSLNFQFNSIHDNVVASSVAMDITSTSGNNYTISNNVVYNTAAEGILIASATSAVHVFDNNLVMKAGTNGFNFNDVGCTVTNNNFAGNGSIGINLSEINGVFGIFSGNVSHTNSSSGIAFAGIATALISSCRCWRNGGGTAGFFIGSAGGVGMNVIFDSCVAFGNFSRGFLNNGTHVGLILLVNCTVDGGATFNQSIGFGFTTGLSTLEIENTTFGNTNAHATGDFSIESANVFVRAYLRNVKLASTPEIANQTNLLPGSSIGSQKHDQVSGNNRTWMAFGTISIDTSIYNTASPSLRLTPLSASNKLESSPPYAGFRIPVASGASLTPTVYVYKSASGDGAAYNGNQPRLVVRKNVALGIASDTVLATYSAGTGSWNTLSGTTITATEDGVMEFIVDCDGTAGWINIDDFSVA